MIKQFQVMNPIKIDKYFTCVKRKWKRRNKTDCNKVRQLETKRSIILERKQTSPGQGTRISRKDKPYARIAHLLLKDKANEHQTHHRTTTPTPAGTPVTPLAILINIQLNGNWSRDLDYKTESSRVPVSTKTISWQEI